MPKHIVRLLLLMVICAVAAYAGKQYLTVDSFYQFGHYRGDSVAEIASDKPKYAIPMNCQICHVERYTEWSQGIHNLPELGKGVKCDVCHGAPGSQDNKPETYEFLTAAKHMKNFKPQTPAENIKQCTLCHEQMPGRPVEQKQIMVATHSGTQPCRDCHNLHSPRTFIGPLASTSKPGNAEAGKPLAAICMGCHGKTGVSENPIIPSLAGQKEAYLADSLKAYQKGQRVDPMMSAIAKTLPPNSSENLAAYHASMTCKSVQDGDPKVAAIGHVLAQKCVTCHGVNGVSNQPMWPSLAGQPKEYLVKALKSYKTKPGRKNGMMNIISKNLNDGDIQALAAYYANVACK